MSSKPNEYCDICRQQDKKKRAENWCLICSESLFSDCSKHHKVQSSTKSHRLNPFEDISSLPSVVLSIKTECKIHGGKLDYFCTHHNESCCVKCVPGQHQKCEGFLETLDDIVKKSKCSTIVGELNENVCKVKGTIETLLQNKKQNYKSLQSEKKMMEERVKVLKLEMIKNIDAFERQILKEISESIEICKYEMDETVDKLEEFRKQCNHIDKSVKDMNKVASNLQIFLGSKSLESKLFGIEKEIVGMGKRIGSHSIELKINFNSDSFETTIRSFVKTNILKDDFKGDLRFQKLKQAQTIKPKEDEKPSNIMNKRVHKNDELALTHELRSTSYCQIQQKFMLPTTEYININGCEILSDGRFLFADFDNNRLILFESTDQNKKEINLFASPWGICSIKKNVVAVNFPVQSKIQIIDITSSRAKVLQDFSPESGMCTAMTFSSNKLIVFIRGFGFQITEIDGTVVKSVRLQFHDVKYIATDSDRLFYTDWKNNAVVCCNMDGNIVWKYENKSLRYPSGISVDKDGNVYVVGTSSANVYRISSDGNTGKDILNVEENCKSPTAIVINKDKRLALICFHDNPFAALYELL